MPYKDPIKAKQYAKEYREKNKEKLSEYEKERSKDPKRKADSKRYSQSEKGKASQKRRSKKYCGEHPDKIIRQRKIFLINNPDYFREYDKAHKEERKQYRIDNKEKLNKQKRERNKLHPEKKAADDKRYRVKHPEKIKAGNRKKILKQYNLNQEQFDQLVEAHNNKCGICSKQFNEKICIDHDHVTGKIRGLLCHHCNSGLGLLGDNRESVVKALKYLDKQD